MTQAESDTLGLSPVQIQALPFTAYTRSDVATVGNFANTIGTTHVTAVKILNGLVRRVLIIAKSSDLALFNYKGKGDPWQAFLLWGHLLDDALQPIPEELLAHFEVGIGSIIYPMQKEGHLIVSKPF